MPKAHPGKRPASSSDVYQSGFAEEPANTFELLPAKSIEIAPAGERNETLENEARELLTYLVSACEELLVSVQKELPNSFVERVRFEGNHLLAILAFPTEKIDWRELYMRINNIHNILINDSDQDNLSSIKKAMIYDIIVDLELFANHSPELKEIAARERRKEQRTESDPRLESGLSDTYLDEANRSLRSTSTILTSAVSRFDRWYVSYSTMAEISRRKTEQTTRDLKVALGKWGLSYGEG